MMPQSGRTQFNINRRFALAAGAVFVAIDLIAVMLRRVRYPGDFDISMEFGRRFLLGRHLYQGGLHFPYLPSAAMFFCGFSLLPRPLAFVLFYSLAILSVWLTLRMLAAMVCATNTILGGRTVTVAALTLVLASHYIIRDLDDGGPNLVLLALVMGGIYYAWAGRDIAAAGFFGAAAAFKITTAIFIPFLLWKRRWRLAAYAAVAAMFWMTLPVLRMGPAAWWAHQREWLASAGGFAAGFNGAAAYYYGAGNLENQALRPAVDHLLGIWPGTAGGGARAIGAIAAALLLAWFCSLTARPYGEQLDIRWLRESCGLLIVAVLLAPIAWMQHLVLAIPALYLIAADWLAGEQFGILPKSAMSIFVLFALVLNREIMGKARYLVLLGYHVQTLCMLLLFGVLMLRRNQPDAARAAVAPAQSSGMR